MTTAPLRPRRLLALLPLGIFLALAALFLGSLFKQDKTTLPSALIGQPAPQLVLPALEGAVFGGRALPGIAAGDLAQGAVSLVNVFASWCAPCHAEHPFLMQIATDKSVRIFGINQKDRPENARRFLTEKGNPYHAVGVDGGRASIEWGVYGVPETFVVGPDGRIRFKLVGPITAANLDQLKAEIEKARK
jgi:cytochrome c biogenesis protein CcmG, thiol:disulfide interchange protein DsbE